jgi:MYXO-CTERM domain-containing protein
LQLRAFQRVSLASGATRRLTFTLEPSAFTFWSAGRQGTVAYPGTYGVAVGSSSRDLRLNGSFEIQGGPLSGTVQQAETAILCCGASVAKDAKGYTGPGFVTGFNRVGSATAFDLTVPTSRSCALTARYSAAIAAEANQPIHTLSLYVNGSKVRPVTFPPLANLDTWDFETETVELRAGANTVSYVRDVGDTGDIELDAILDCPFAEAGTSRDGGAGGSAAVGAHGRFDAACPVACAPPVSDAGCGCRMADRTPASDGAHALGGLLSVFVALGRRRRRGGGGP